MSQENKQRRKFEVRIRSSFPDQTNSHPVSSGQLEIIENDAGKNIVSHSKVKS